MSVQHEPPDESQSSITSLLRDWQNEVLRSQRGHYRSAIYYAKLHRWIGIPTAIAAAGAGALNTFEYDVANIFGGLLGIGGAILAGVQTFLGLAERAEKHRSSGAENGGIIREIKILLALPIIPDKQSLDHVRERRDSLASRSPTIPERIWARAHIPTREEQEQERQDGFA